MGYQRPKGTADILPGETQKWQYVEQTARKVFNNYQFNEIRTPIFESFDVFSRSVGDTSDIVTKEMYDFYDKGKRHIVLRPEGTAGIVRAYVENKLFGPEHPKPVKVYYMGPMFRYERPQSGRMREFHQIGVEALGSPSPTVDVETIAMALGLFKQLGIGGLKLVINTLGDLDSRQAYRQALIAFLEPHFDELSADSQVRLHKNPLRVLDSKDKKDQAIVADAPSILDFLDEESTAHFTMVKTLLENLGIEYEIDATMVRGLDYYNHTIFEIMSNSKAFGGQYMTVCAGGRYNGLVEEIGGPATPGFGFGLGLERMLLVMDADGIDVPATADLAAYVVGIGAETQPAVVQVTQAIRSAGFTAEHDYLDRKPKAQFKMANRLNAEVVITIGESELATKSAHLKNMATGNEITVPLAEIEQDFATVLAQVRGEQRG
ncbi:histidine--tRNA ligase [Loigolactobacillus zhaoyuanensis]|uniref:histidine--tRNA ligase n=1 Tax=Loigolactobacillus zhaoyuanensis TaxID=2486017 RepID=UPI000F73871D|nr:histidine--tRNA ligase [Loigolactobacillus zhaoyuanensis]